MCESYYAIVEAMTAVANEELGRGDVLANVMFFENEASMTTPNQEHYAL
jgi:hypothetical protein